VLEGITREKKSGKLEHGSASSNSNDLITCLLSLTDDHGDRLLTDEEIVDNAMVALIAGHDTSSILMTFMVRQLANDPVTLAAMVQGKYTSRSLYLHNS
jgi:cytochrome P450